MKIVTVIGARPQFIKAAVVSRALKNDPNFAEVIIHTGQHYDAAMSDIFFEEMDIPKPDYFLGIGGKSHGAMTGEMIVKIEELLLKEKPDALLIYGDTNSTLAGAIAASKLHIPIAHVEAGLRSFNMRMPEEINRILADRVSKWLFCPTSNAVEQLKKEGITNQGSIVVDNVGDVMYDAAIFYSKQNRTSSGTEKLIRELGQGEFYLSTIHRAENTDDPARLKSIMSALDEVGSQKTVILPLHPRTRKMLELNQIKLSNVRLIDPVGYFDMIALLKGSSGVLTDSGGLQKEAYFFANPCLTLRDETEWIELVESGFNRLVGADKNRITAEAAKFLGKKLDNSLPLYGNADAGNLILKGLR